MIIDTKDSSNGYVKSEVHNNVITIEFYHPQGNSLPSNIIADLAHEIGYAAHNKDIHVVLLRAAGSGAFCGGASFDELLSIENEKAGIKFFNGFANVMNTMRKCPKLIVARVHGKCVGGGVGLAAAADYAIAVEGAEVKLSELSIGIGPLVVGPAIERKMGLSAYSQLAIDSAMWRNADWARRKGLYAELHPTLESMEESIARLTATLAHTSPDAMAEMKRIFWHDTDHWDALLQERANTCGRLVVSSYAKEYFRKFKEKKNVTV